MPRNSTPARLSFAPRLWVPIGVWSGPWPLALHSTLHFLPRPWNRNQNHIRTWIWIQSHTRRSVVAESWSSCLWNWCHTRAKNNKHKLAGDPPFERRKLKGEGSWKSAVQVPTGYSIPTFWSWSTAMSFYWLRDWPSQLRHHMPNAFTSAVKGYTDSKKYSTLTTLNWTIFCWIIKC